ncbi:hypothetical protein ACI2L1_27385 [Streptomyces sp. NPDC019531]|uniref:hypothetical protein n=1 Tax=Streptomyces sp. NPDC019531 TaxID=3365062 RepID=UPI00384B093C
MWQRTVTRWAFALAVLSLVLLGVAVLTLREGDLAADLVNTVVAGANVAFVVFTWAVFKAGQEHIAQMRTDCTNAENAYSEAVKTRLDQLAPRVSVSYDRWETALGGRCRGSGALVQAKCMSMRRLSALIARSCPTTRRDNASCTDSAMRIPPGRRHLEWEMRKIQDVIG